MSLRRTLPSNGTGLHMALEVAPGVLPSEDVVPGTNVWLQLEPNSYDGFGTELELVSRQPLSSDRQPRKGVVVGGDTTGGFENDLTFTAAMKELLSGFFFANIRKKANADGTAVTGTGVTVASGGTDFTENSMVLISESPVATNNGIKFVGSGSTATNIAIAGLTADAGAVKVKVVGYRGAAGALDIDATANGYPAIVGTRLNTLGLIPGEFIFIGGDALANRFTDVKNNGWARVKSVTATRITLDKTDYEMVDETGTGKSIDLFFGDVLKNEVGTDIVRKTYRLERSLGQPETTAPTGTQADVLTAAMANELSIAIPKKDIIKLSFSFVAGEYLTRPYTQGLYPGTREVLADEDAFNSSGDMKRERLAVYPSQGALTSAPLPLFALVSETKITINNNSTGINAHRFIGFVEVVEGMFEFSGDITAYFNNVEATEAVKANRDVTYDFACMKNNAGFALDMPMISLGKGVLELAVNEPIMIPLDMQASTGSKYDVNMNHTGMMVFFDYLPNFAGRRVD